MKRIYGVLLAVLLIGMLSGCSTTQHLPKGEFLLRKNTLAIETPVNTAKKSELSEALGNLENQKPNTYLFGLFPYKVWFYNLQYKKYQKDTTNFQIKHKFVEMPVIFDSLKMHKSSEEMQKYLVNQGFFYANVSDSVHFHHRKSFVKYKVHTGISYHIDSVTYSIKNKKIANLLPHLKRGTYFKTGRAYSHTLAVKERNRLVKVVKNYGYFNFKPGNISFELDTLLNTTLPLSGNIFENTINFILQAGETGKQHFLNIRTIIHKAEDSLAFNQYKFKHVWVFPDYSDSLKVDSINYKKTSYNGITFRYRKSRINPGIIDRKLFIRPGDKYSLEAYNKTIRELNNLGIFQYVRVYIFPSRKDSTHHLLNCVVVAAPSKKYNFQANIEASGGDLYVVGAAANVSVTDNNFLKGANQLTTTVSYGLEMGQDKSADVPFLKQFYVFSNNVGVNFKLSFPKFLLPINRDLFNRNNLPTTFVEAGLNFLKRHNFFSLRSFNGDFGYSWRQTSTQSWIVKPIFVNLLHLSHIAPAFQERMDSVPAIRHSYQETFVEGERLEYILNRAGINKKHYFYLKGGMEESGALLGLIKAVPGIFGQPLHFSNSHYVRMDFDARQYFINPFSSFILRLSGGVGIPYGKSRVMPYIKQYFVGGAYSIRGWRPRVLGPGSYNALDRNKGNKLFIDESGDIKLEGNAEYRFTMFQMFSGAIKVNGALFVDAGNIWLTYPDKKLPGANFEFKSLYQDIAVSGGAGVRLDLGGFLVLRLDWAIKMKKPYVLEHHGWTLNKIDFGSRDWRRENLNFNLAIGYPF